MWGFIFQFCLHLVWLIWPSNVPPTWNSLVDKFPRGLQRRTPWRRWIPHSTRLSTWRMTFQPWKRTKLHGPNLVTAVSDAAVCSPIRSIRPRRGQRCEPVRCHGGTALFVKCGLFFWNSALHQPLIQCSKALWLCCPSLSSGCTWHVVSPRKLWPSTFWPIERPSTSLGHVCWVTWTI